jgi:hypothetical protein
MTEIMRVLEYHTPRCWYIEEVEVVMGGREFVNNRGKVAKRIRRNLKSKHEISISPEVVSEIGNIANRYTLREKQYTIELTRDLYGTVGNFGDDNSCFREGHENYHHLLAMDDRPDFYAVRVYNHHGSPTARSWAYDSGDGGLVLFNAYGVTLYKIAKLLGYALEEEFRQVSYNYDGWLNQRNCYAVGGDPEAKIFRVYIHPDEYEDQEGREYCCDCDREINTEYDEYMIADHGDVYCWPCWRRDRTQCRHCGNWHLDYETTFTDVYYFSDQQIAVCENCLHHYHPCENCGGRHRSRNMTEQEVGGALLRLCGDCRRYRLGHCGQCEELHLNSNLKPWIEEGYIQEHVCPDCYDMRSGISATPGTSPICRDCGAWVPTTIGEDGRCQNCGDQGDTAETETADNGSAMCGICGIVHEHEFMHDCQHCHDCGEIATASGSDYIQIAVFDRPCARFCDDVVRNGNAACVPCVQHRYNPAYRYIEVDTAEDPVVEQVAATTGTRGGA